jgi:hypothetical protein
LRGGGYAAADGDIARRDIVAMTAARDQGSHWHSVPMAGDKLSRQRNTTTNHDDDVAMEMNAALQGWTMRQTGAITSQKQSKYYLLKIYYFYYVSIMLCFSTPTCRLPKPSIKTFAHGVRMTAICWIGCQQPIGGARGKSRCTPWSADFGGQLGFKRPSSGGTRGVRRNSTIEGKRNLTKSNWG